MRMGRHRNLPVVAVICVSALTLIFTGGCKKDDKKLYPPPIGIDYNQKKISFDAVIQRANTDAGSHQFITYEHGSTASNTFFKTAVAPQSVYEALVYLGGTPSNNVTVDNYGDPDIATQGDIIEITFTWEGAPLEYTLDEILTEDSSLPAGGPFGVEIRFGGNYQGVPGTNMADQTGCITCLYTCPSGITSNANWNKYLYETDGAWRYKGNTAVLPPDGTVVRITYTLVP